MEGDIALLLTLVMLAGLLPSIPAYAAEDDLFEDVRQRRKRR